MTSTVIITSRFYKSVCSVVRGTGEQVAAVVGYDKDAHGFKSYKPSDWDYRGDVIDLGNTTTYNACNDIIKGVAQLPKESRWLAQ